MDSLAFRLANALVGNDPGAAGLEITLSGMAQHAKRAVHTVRMHSIESLSVYGSTYMLQSKHAKRELLVCSAGSRR